jgi:hypothetical protein
MEECGRRFCMLQMSGIPLHTEATRWRNVAVLTEQKVLHVAVVWYNTTHRSNQVEECGSTDGAEGSACCSCQVYHYT